MNYEKEYKEALEKARIWQNHLYETNDKDYADELYYIFPQLKQSENERIKSLIKGCAYAADITPEGREEIFAWLEKQSNISNKATYTQEVKIGNGNIRALVTEEIPIDKIEPKQLDPDKVIEWLIRYMPIFWDTPCNPQQIVEQFKEDFKL